MRSNKMHNGELNRGLKTGFRSIPIFALICIFINWPAAADPASETDDKETIVIRADRAWEEPDSDQVLHFEGNFELISPEWELRSDEADIYGPLDDLDRIVARGSPAVLTILPDPEADDGSEEEPVIGTGDTIEYQRELDVLILTGNAYLSGDSVSMKSSEIVYSVGDNRLKSSGNDGVEMVLERAKP